MSKIGLSSRSKEWNCSIFLLP